MKKARVNDRSKQAIPLLVLAGLPHSNSAQVAQSVSSAIAPKPRTIHLPSTGKNNQLYTPEVITGFIRSVTEYAQRQLKGGAKRPSSPSQIILAYVPSPDVEKLLIQFDFYVFPVCLDELGEYDEHGKQKRHNTEDAKKYIIQKLIAAQSDFAQVKRRLSSPPMNEPLLLPPQNFRLADKVIAEVFLEMRKSKREWTDTINEVQSHQVTNDDFPKHVAKGARKRILVDNRNLYFPIDPSGHGLTRQLEDASSSVDRVALMRSSFRFGVLLTAGIHHDAQFLKAQLDNEIFECSINGNITVSGTHANVYPDDFVRG